MNVQACNITETFESVRSDIATAWNKAMIWIDDEVVFARLNTLLSVAKEAADRVIEAALRADKNAADTFNNVQADPDGLPRTMRRDNTKPAKSP